MKISYKLTKRTTKTVKFEKKLKLYIIKFKNICSNMSTSDNIVHSIFTYKLMRLVSNLQLPIEQKKQAKTSNSRKNWARKVSKALKSKRFNKLFPVSNNFFNSNEILLFQQYNFKKSSIWRNTLEQQNFWENS